jgi:hypothetical protein
LADTTDARETASKQKKVATEKLLDMVETPQK